MGQWYTNLVNLPDDKQIAEKLHVILGYKMHELIYMHEVLQVEKVEDKYLVVVGEDLDAKAMANILDPISEYLETPLSALTSYNSVERIHATEETLRQLRPLLKDGVSFTEGQCTQNWHIGLDNKEIFGVTVRQNLCLNQGISYSDIIYSYTETSIGVYTFSNLK